MHLGEGRTDNHCVDAHQILIEFCLKLYRYQTKHELSQSRPIFRWNLKMIIDKTADFLVGDQGLTAAILVVTVAALVAYVVDKTLWGYSSALGAGAILSTITWCRTSRLMHERDLKALRWRPIMSGVVVSAIVLALFESIRIWTEPGVALAKISGSSTETPQLVAGILFILGVVVIAWGAAISVWGIPQLIILKDDIDDIRKRHVACHGSKPVDHQTVSRQPATTF